VKFHLIDKVHSIATSPDGPHRILASKHVSMAEEYLADHFPGFPVLPGVMMLEALTQAAAWLMYVESNFAKSMAVLKEVRNLRYGNFVAPGNVLTLDVERIKSTDTGAVFKAVGSIGDQQALTGRLEMVYFNLADKDPNLATNDELLITFTKNRWNVLAPQGRMAI